MESFVTEDDDDDDLCLQMSKGKLITNTLEYNRTGQHGRPTKQNNFLFDFLKRVKPPKQKIQKEKVAVQNRLFREFDVGKLVGEDEYYSVIQDRDIDIMRDEDEGIESEDQLAAKENQDTLDLQMQNLAKDNSDRKFVWKELEDQGEEDGDINLET